MCTGSLWCTRAGRHLGVRGRNLVQPSFAAAQDEGKAVVVRGLGEGGESCLLQEGVELGYAVLT